MKQYSRKSKKLSAIFRQESKPMQTLGRWLSVAALNLAVLLCSLPLVTIGPAFTALYRALPLRDQGFDVCVVRFFRELRRSFRAAILPGLLLLLSGAGLAAAWYLALLLGKTNHFLLMLPLFLATALLALLLIWLCPVLSAKQDGTALKTALLLGLRELPRSLLALVPQLVVLVLPLYCTSLTRVGFYLFFGIAPLCCLKLKILAPILSSHWEDA